MLSVNEILRSIDWQEFLKTGFRMAVILICGWVAMLIVSKLIDRLEKRLIQKSLAEGEPPSESAKRIDTISRLLKEAVFLALWLTVALMVLKEIGVEIGPILASAGILGLAIGFGAQNLVRDIISGIFIIMENQIRVGDVALVNGTGGLVEKINFRTIVLRDQAGVVHVFPNGSVTSLSNMTKEWSAYTFSKSALPTRRIPTELLRSCSGWVGKCWTIRLSADRCSGCRRDSGSTGSTIRR